MGGGRLSEDRGPWSSVPGVVFIGGGDLGKKLSIQSTFVMLVLFLAGLGLCLSVRSVSFGVIFAIGSAVFFVALVVGLFTEPAYSARIRRVRENANPDTWSGRATLAMALGRGRSAWGSADRRRGVHEEAWFSFPDTDQEGEPRPRVILVDVDPDYAEGGEEITEPVEVGPIRRMTKSDRRRRIRQVILLSIAVVFVSAPWLTRSGAPRIWAAWFIVQLCITLYGLGWSPIQIDSSIASVGALDVIRFGIKRSYDAGTAVIVLEPAGGARSRHLTLAQTQIAAYVISRAGQRSTLLFNNIYDPGLSDLLGRWLGSVPPNTR